MSSVKRLCAKLGFRVASWEGTSSIYDLQRKIRDQLITWPYTLSGEISRLSSPGVMGGDVIELYDQTVGDIWVEIPKKLSKGINIESKLRLDIKPIEYTAQQLKDIEKDHLEKAEFVALDVTILNPEDKSKIKAERARRVTINRYIEKRPFPEVLTSLRVYFEGNYPDIAKSLNPGASIEMIQEFESVVGVRLPEEFYTLYQFANGQGGVATPLFPDGYSFNTLEASRQSWTDMKKMLEVGEFDWVDGIDWGPIRGTWWDVKWIPLAMAISGHQYCLDLNPSDTGNAGQIISFINDDDERLHLANGLSDFIGGFLADLESGKYIHNTEYDYFEKVKSK